MEQRWRVEKVRVGVGERGRLRDEEREGERKE